MSKLSEILRDGEDGAMLWFCPGCKMVHQIHVGPGEGRPGPRWSWNESVDKPTFSPSVLVTGSQQLTEEQCAFIQGGGKIEPVRSVCHSFVVDGEMKFLDDCTHELAGQTVPIPPFHEDDD